ncbi:hypothetical protein JB92DRAFT_3007743, partial [Gautieria morchelliformis]
MCCIITPKTQYQSHYLRVSRGVVGGARITQIRKHDEGCHTCFPCSKQPRFEARCKLRGSASGAARQRNEETLVWMVETIPSTTWVTGQASRGDEGRGEGSSRRGTKRSYKFHSYSYGEDGKRTEWTRGKPRGGAAGVIRRRSEETLVWVFETIPGMTATQGDEGRGREKAGASEERGDIRPHYNSKNESQFRSYYFSEDWQKTEWIH